MFVAFQFSILPLGIAAFVGSKQHPSTREPPPIIQRIRESFVAKVAPLIDLSPFSQSERRGLSPATGTPNLSESEIRDFKNDIDEAIRRITEERNSRRWGGSESAGERQAGQQNVEAVNHSGELTDAEKVQKDRLSSSFH